MCLSGQTIEQIVAGQEGFFGPSNDCQCIALASLFARSGDRGLEIMNALFCQAPTEGHGLFRIASRCIDKNLSRAQSRFQLVKNPFDDVRGIQTDNHSIALVERVVRPLRSPRNQRIRFVTGTGVDKDRLAGGQQSLAKCRTK